MTLGLQVDLVTGREFRSHRLLIFYRTRHPHSSPRCRVGTTSPQSEIAHSQSLLDDNDDDDDDDDDDNNNDDDGEYTPHSTVRTVTEPACSSSCRLCGEE